MQSVWRMACIACCKFVSVSEQASTVGKLSSAKWTHVQEGVIFLHLFSSDDLGVSDDRRVVVQQLDECFVSGSVQHIRIQLLEQWPWTNIVETLFAVLL